MAFASALHVAGVFGMARPVRLGLFAAFSTRSEVKGKRKERMRGRTRYSTECHDRYDAGRRLLIAGRINNGR